jgi:hypothetical protein
MISIRPFVWSVGWAKTPANKAQYFVRSDAGVVPTCNLSACRTVDVGTRPKRAAIVRRRRA